MTAWNSHGDYKVLYANLADKDGGAVIAQLSQMNVPYRMSEGGSAILVPGGTSSRPAPEDGDRRPAEGRGLRLRADGQRPLRPDPVPGAPHLPARPRRRADALDRLARRRAGGARPPRAAEPERLLSRAAEAERLGAADAAPRPRPRPRADRRHRPPRLVERSRDEPEGGEHPRPERRAADRRRRARPGAGLDAQQLQYVNQIEAGYTKRILELVEPIVGHDNLRASVTADVDFSQTEATSEEFKPNQGADASVSIRSQQTTEQGGGAGGALASGVPGAASNQPPIAATAPLTGASQPLQGAPAGTSPPAAAAGARR